MSTNFNTLAAIIVLGFAATVTVTTASAQTTRLKELNGSTTIVHTNSNGTTTANSNAQSNPVYTSGGNRHQAQVDYSKNQGAVVQQPAPKK